MKGKKLLAAFLLGVGLCFVPVLGYGENIPPEVLKVIPSKVWDMTLVTGLVALFTASLVIVGYLQVRTMRRYTEVTTRLLKQSEKAFKQSLVAFESDLVSRIMFYGAELRGKEVTTRYFAEGFVNGMIAVVHKVDRSLYKKVIDDIGAFSEARGAENYAWATEQAKKKLTEMKNEVNND